MKYKPVPTWEDYEIAEKNGISKVNVDQRINALGWTLEKAITQPMRVRFRHKYKEYVQLAESNGIPFITFRARVENHNWSPEEAAVTPVMTMKEVAEKRNEKNRIIPKEIYEKARGNGINDSTLKTRILMLNWDMDLAATKQVNKKYKAKLERRAN